MKEYFFLYFLAFVWILFAVVQDMRTREISNWLNFSLIAIVLAYRGFYASYVNDVMFFVYGVLGVLLFVGFAFLFYYGRIFAGGDAKLLMGIGGIWPYSGFGDLFLFGIAYVFFLFVAGSIWTIVFSFYLLKDNSKKFWSNVKRETNRSKMLIVFGALGGISIIVILAGSNLFYLWYLGVLLGLMPLMYVYAKAIEKTHMIKLVEARNLTEGDWLEREVRIGKHILRKSVHGLSREDIKLLRNKRMKVWIKEGVPFSVAFLVSLIGMIYFLRYSPL